MTDQEKDKLIIEELGIEWSYAKWRASPRWCRFGIIWERAQRMGWWPRFLWFLWARPGENSYLADNLKAIPSYYVHPDRFRDALAEFLERRKDD